MVLEAMTVIEYTVAHEVQELNFIGDLMLRQNNVLLHDEIYYLEDNSTDLNTLSLSGLLVENSNRLRKHQQSLCSSQLFRREKIDASQFMQFQVK